MKTNILKKIGLVGLMALCVCSFSAFSAGAEEPIIEIVKIRSGSGRYPAIYQDKIVWADNRTGVNYFDIYMYDLSSNQEIQITTDPNIEYAPEIYGDRIVWEQYISGQYNHDIYMYDLSSNRQFQITTDSSRQLQPTIYGDRIVWDDSSQDIYMYDLSLGKEILIASGPSNQSRVDIYGDRIVWDDNRNGNYDIYMYDLSVDTDGDGIPNYLEDPRPNPDPAEVQITTDSVDEYDAHIYENKIVWWDNPAGGRTIYMYDLSSGQKVQITEYLSQKGFLRIHGDKIVWSDDRNGYNDIYMYDLSHNQETRITTGSALNMCCDVYGDRIVWETLGSNGGIYMATISYPAPPPPPAAPSNLKLIAYTTYPPYGLTIQWQDNSDNEESFEIERIIDESHIVFTVPANTTTFTDFLPLEWGGECTYYVWAVNSAGRSIDKAAMSVTPSTITLTYLGQPVASALVGLYQYYPPYDPYFVDFRHTDENGVASFVVLEGVTYIFAIAELDPPLLDVYWTEPFTAPADIVFDIPPLPLNAEFSAEPLSGEVPLTVQFTDKSTGNITNWEWDFGDHTYSTEQNPTHTYIRPNTYTVSLTVREQTGYYGEIDTETKEGYIIVEDTTPPTIDITSPISGEKYSPPITVSGTFTDNAYTEGTLSVAVNGVTVVQPVLTEYGEFSYTFDKDVLTEGLNTITVKAEDKVGNVRSVDVTITVEIPPTIYLSRVSINDGMPTSIEPLVFQSYLDSLSLDYQQDERKWLTTYYTFDGNKYVLKPGPLETQLIHVMKRFGYDCNGALDPGEEVDMTIYIILRGYSGSYPYGTLSSNDCEVDQTNNHIQFRPIDDWYSNKYYSTSRFRITVPDYAVSGDKLHFTLSFDNNNPNTLEFTLPLTSWPHALEMRKIPFYPNIADLDLDGNLETIFTNVRRGTAGNQLHVVDENGSLKWARWFYGSNYTSKAVVGDVDAEVPGLEILVPSGNNMYCLASDGTVLWEYPFGPVHNVNTMMQEIFIDDVYPDLPGQEVLYTFRDATGYDYEGFRYGCEILKSKGYDSNGEVQYEILSAVNLPPNPEGWPHWQYWIKAIADLNELYPGPELLLIRNIYDGEYLCMTFNGEILWSFNTGTFLPGFEKGPVIADVMPDIPGLEVILVNTNMEIFCLHNQGKLLWRYLDTEQIDPTENYQTSEVAVADLNPDIPGLETVFISLGRNLQCLNSDGELLWSVPLKGWFPSAYPVIADIDGDEVLEIVVNGDGLWYWESGDYVNRAKIRCFDGYGNQEWENEVPSIWTADSYGAWGTALADFNRDGKMEIVISDYDSAFLYCLDHEGNMFIPGEKGTAPYNPLPWPTENGNYQRTGEYTEGLAYYIKVVKNAGELMEAIATAEGGDTILLEPGNEAYDFRNINTIQVIGGPERILKITKDITIMAMDKNPDNTVIHLGTLCIAAENSKVTLQGLTIRDYVEELQPIGSDDNQSGYGYNYRENGPIQNYGGTLTLRNCKIMYNEGSKVSAIYTHYKSFLNLENTLVAENTSTFLGDYECRGAIYMDKGAQLDIKKSTIADNYIRKDAYGIDIGYEVPYGAVCFYFGGGMNITDSILYWNGILSNDGTEAETGKTFYAIAHPQIVDITYSDVEHYNSGYGSWPPFGIGVIHEDPIFDENHIPGNPNCADMGARF